MHIEKTAAKSEGVRFSIDRDGKEVARAYLFLMWNSLHEAPFGLLEDVYVDEPARGSGLGTEIVNAVVTEAKGRGCYKLVATSRYARPKVHELYARLGFKDHGKEFRIDL
ncbi:MAG: GNAT family N-acetyltransferase [Betaproteobacteria bacterium]|nr:MAG: GNAT family N-acetyltransferase [Betaproteobacteria bacterium]TMH82218.1 MAG: GNAT family N-acetyltransferase [Betaproteobacteria bacterium]